MHTLLEANGATGQHVPAFLAKLWKIVDDQTTNDLICWSDSGNSFVIHNQAKFARELLPLYYKHNNMASFVRQLNMYGFHKVVSVEQGGLKVDKDEIEFAHPFFLRGQESSLELIKRKLPSTKLEDSRAHPESLSKVLIDVRQMKGRQETMDEKLLTMKRENESLWRELASLRQKHAKQQQIVSKLLQFLVGMMSQSQSRRLPSYKRRAPLMLNDTDSVKASKISRANRPEITGGPVIRDITEGDEPEDEYGDDNSQYIDNLVTSPDVPENEQQQDQQIGIINDFENPEQLLTVDPSVLIPNNDKKSAQASGKIIKMEPQAATSSGNMYYITGPGGIQQPVQVIYSQPQQIQDMVQGQQALIQQTTLPSSSSSAATPTTSTQQIEVPSSSAYHEKTLEKEDLDFHVDEMQLGLEHLKDLFSADKSISETDALMGLFGEGAGHLDFGNNNVNNTGDDKSKTTQNNEAPIGNELVSYNPSLFELTEDDTHFFDDSSADFLDKELESMLTTEKDKLNTRTSFAPLTFTSLPSQTDDSLLHTPVDTPSSSSNILLTPPASSPSTNRRKRK